MPREASLICSRRFGDCKRYEQYPDFHVERPGAGVPAYYNGSAAGHSHDLYRGLPIVDKTIMITTVKLDTGIPFSTVLDSHQRIRRAFGAYPGEQDADRHYAPNEHRDPVLNTCEKSRCPTASDPRRDYCSVAIHLHWLFRHEHARGNEPIPTRKSGRLLRRYFQTVARTSSG